MNEEHFITAAEIETLEKLFDTMLETDEDLIALAEIFYEEE